MTTKLRLADDLELPPEAQTETFAFLARRGSGKTYAALVLAEELAGAGLRFVILDPVGVCWGLRSSADGSGPGVAIAVLGGEHGDLPLEVTSGELVADLVVDQHASLILDLSAFRKGEMVRFVTEFAETLYRRNREPIHLILDEADAFAPQRPGPDQARCLGAVEDLVRRGRARGIGVSMLTQRPAVLNKDVLTQAEVLVAMRTIGLHDRKAIAAWVEVHGDEEQLAKLDASLPSMQPGEAWVWSPSWLGVLKRIRFRKRRTFDSSRTPKAGEKRQAARVLAKVDLEDLRGRMASVAATVADRDPKTLKARIRDLEEKLAAKVSPAAPVVERVEVPVFLPEHREMLLEVANRLETAAAAAIEASREARAGCSEVREAIAAAARRTPVPRPAAGGAHDGPRSRRPAPAAAAPPARPAARARKVAESDLPPRQVRLLETLARLASAGISPIDRTQLALWAGVSPKSSSYANDLGALRTAGRIEYPGAATVALLAGAWSASAPPLTREELLEHVRALVPPRQWKILEVLLDWDPADGPAVFKREDLAEQAGISPASSSFANDFGALRTMGLITYPGGGLVALGEVLIA